MKLQRFTYQIYILIILSFLGLYACSGAEEMSGIEPPVQEQNNMKIRWNVHSEVLDGGRSLIDDDATLQRSCSNGQAIGIWSAYVLDGVEFTNVLGATNDVSLIYRVNTSWDNWAGWTYGKIAALWKSDAIYYFNAYFPKDNGLKELSNTKNALLGKYNTIVTQEDLLVEKLVIDTGAETFQGSPVLLDMKHALAALCFEFQSVDGTPMKLKSFALKNTKEEGTGIVQGLGTSGTLAYQGESVELSNWTVTSPLPTDKLYDWQHLGVNFSTTSVTAYQKTGTIVGNLYTNNDGYVLIIPQEYDGKTKMIFETDKNSIPYEVTLPAPSKEGTVNKFLPGYRYTYIIKIAGKDVTLECVAQPWDLVETTNEFSTVVSVLEEDRINWTAGSHYDNDADPNNNEQIVLWDDINNPAEFSFKIAHPLGGTWHAVLRTISGATDAFELRDTEGNIKMDGAVGEEVTLRVCAKRENTTTVSNVAELMFVVRSSGHILPVDMITVLGEGQNYKIVQNINK